MLPTFARQTITRIRPGTKSERGSEVPDWSDNAVSRLTIRGCSVQPAGTTLSMDGRVLGISDGITAYLPEDADVKAGDRIEIRGEAYVINGEPRRWRGVGRCSNIQLNLTRWEG